MQSSGTLQLFSMALWAQTTLNHTLCSELLKLHRMALNDQRFYLKKLEGTNPKTSKCFLCRRAVSWRGNMKQGTQDNHLCLINVKWRVTLWIQNTFLDSLDTKVHVAETPQLIWMESVRSRHLDPWPVYSRTCSIPRKRHAEMVRGKLCGKMM